MVVDTGAVVSVILPMTLANLFHTGPLSSTSTILTTYTGDPMPVGAEMKGEVSYGEQNTMLSLYVVQCRRAKSKPNGIVELQLCWYGNHSNPISNQVLSV